MKIRIDHEVDANYFEFIIAEILFINHLITTKEYSHLKYKNLRISKKRIKSDIRKRIETMNGASWTGSCGGDEKYKSKIIEIESEAKRISMKKFPDLYDEYII